MAQTATKRTRVDDSASPPVGRGFGDDRFLDRELSWLESHAQLIDEAENPKHSLTRRMSFLAFFTEKLDEFFGLRVSAIQKRSEPSQKSKDASAAVAAAQQLLAISHRARQLVARQYHCWNHSLRPALQRCGINVVREYELREDQRTSLRKFFRESLGPILTPMAIDKCHPRPVFGNQCLYLGALFSRCSDLGPDRLFAVVPLATEFMRFVPVDGGQQKTFLSLEDAVAANLDQLLGGYKVSDWCAFRFTRDSRVEMVDAYPDCALCSAESKLKARRRSDVVRLEVTAGASREIIRHLIDDSSTSRLEPESENNGKVCSIPGPIDLRGLMQLTKVLQGGQRVTSTRSRNLRRVNGSHHTDMFAKIADRDRLLHHPYESFAPVIEFLNQAASDPKVLSVSQTLYRIGGENPLIAPLIRAAENGKQVTVLVELNARFDEGENILWARKLERDGVHVVFGLRDLKTHCKLAMVVRQEDQGIKRYVHLSTGNYHHTTVPYTDLGLLTANDDIGADTAGIFNWLTGYSEFPSWRKLVVAPDNLHTRTLELINEQAERARNGSASRIFAKVNSLSDRTVIEALYRASQVGVPIELVVSGACTLRPGIPGVSENIRVRSITNGFYEHSRVFVFGPDEEANVFLSSADWMPRNFQRRVEVMFPIEESDLQLRILRKIVPTYLGGVSNARFLQPDGTYVREPRNEASFPAYRCHSSEISLVEGPI